MTALVPQGKQDPIAVCQEVLAQKSKSFALASTLLPGACRAPVAVLYAYCRRVDDAIDLAPKEDRARALATLRLELDAVYREDVSHQDLVLGAFAEVVRRYRIPRSYTEALLDGMEMDVTGAKYPTLEALLLYCHRVAGVVGLMMCHVMGLDDARATRRAAHLGIAMQLTNICRDVDEDFRDGRVYLPTELLGGELEQVPRENVHRAVAALLREADGYYRSADSGVIALPFRCALAVHAARRVYAAIGERLRAAGYDPFRGRVFVPGHHKLWLVFRAFVLTLAELPRRLRSTQHYLPPGQPLAYPDDVLPR